MNAGAAGLALAAATLALSACSSTLRAADRDLARGSYPAAMAAYEATLARRPGPAAAARALFGLGLLHAISDGPDHDPALSHAFFDTLVASFPASPLAAPARALLELLELGEAVTCRVAELEAEATRIEAAGRMAADAARRGDLQIARLHARIAQLEAELRRLEQELQALKAIDLRRRP